MTEDMPPKDVDYLTADNARLRGLLKDAVRETEAFRKERNELRAENHELRKAAEQWRRALVAGSERHEKEVRALLAECDAIRVTLITEPHE